MAYEYCPGLPDTSEVASPVCPGATPCPDKSINPPPIVCKQNRYLLAQHYFKHGQAKKGVTGAYLPACTVCSANINTVLFSRVGQLTEHKGYHVEIPTTQVPPVV